MKSLVYSNFDHNGCNAKSNPKLADGIRNPGAVLAVGVLCVIRQGSLSLLLWTSISMKALSLRVTLSKRFVLQLKWSV